MKTTKESLAVLLVVFLIGVGGGYYSSLQFFRSEAGEHAAVLARSGYIDSALVDVDYAPGIRFNGTIIQKMNDIIVVQPTARSVKEIISGKKKPSPKSINITQATVEATRVVTPQGENIVSYLGDVPVLPNGTPLEIVSSGSPLIYFNPGTRELLLSDGTIIDDYDLDSGQALKELEISWEELQEGDYVTVENYTEENATSTIVTLVEEI